MVEWTLDVLFVYHLFIIVDHGEKMSKEELLSRQTESPSGYVYAEEVPHFFLQSNN